MNRKDVAMGRVNYQELIKESDEELSRCQKSSGKVLVYQRLQMLRILKAGKASTLVEAAPLVGVTERSLQNWWRFYKQQGLESLLRVEPNRKPKLSAQQQHALVEEAAKGEFSTIAEIAAWVEQSFGIDYTEVGMWKLARRLKIKKKTPRPSHVKKDEQAVERFKKTSLA